MLPSHTQHSFGGKIPPPTATPTAIFGRKPRLASHAHYFHHVTHHFHHVATSLSSFGCGPIGCTSRIRIRNGLTTKIWIVPRAVGVALILALALPDITPPSCNPHCNFPPC